MAETTMSQSPEDRSIIDPSPNKPMQFRLVHLIYITSILASPLVLFGTWGILICCFWIFVLYQCATLVEPVQFRLVHLIYITSMLASSLALFGPWGVLIGGIICFFWIFVFYQCATLIEVLAVIASIVILIALMLPVNTGHPQARRRIQCGNNLKQIGLGLHNYHDVYDCFPPASLADEQGNPMHSWRVLILPYIGEQTLYAKYDFSEPWDGPNNIKLLDQMPATFACPDHKHPPTKGVQHTSYLAITGESTVWPDDRVMTFSEIPAGPSNTVFAAEFEERPIPWLKPEDITLTDALEIISTNNPAQLELNHPGGRQVAFGDGSVQFKPGLLTKETWRSLIQIDQGIAEADYEYLPEPVPSTIAHYNLILRIIIFVVLMLLPLGWVAENRRRNRPIF